MEKKEINGIPFGNPECDLEIVDREILDRVDELERRTRLGCEKLERMGQDFANLRSEISAETNDHLAFLDEPILLSQLRIFDGQQEDLLDENGSIFEMIERRKLIKALLTFKNAFKN